MSIQTRSCEAADFPLRRSNSLRVWVAPCDRNNCVILPKPVWPRVLRGLFVIYAAATALHIAWVVHHEPFGFDAWNIALDTNAQPITPARFFNYWWYEYTHSNPRFGQSLTYLAYKLEYFSVIATPIAYLAVSLAVTVLGSGRWPWRRGRDLALWSMVLGSLWFSLPEIGKTLFCRAYCANYIYGLAIQLWFLVPLRVAREAAAPRMGWLVAYGVFGIVAGMSNEHTGPTLCAFLFVYAWWCRRQRHANAPFAWVGASGATLGFAAIFLAPGQSERYDGMAQRVSLVGRMFQRGITGNVEIVGDLILGVAPVLGLIAVVAVIGLARRESEIRERETLRAAMRQIALAMVAALTMAATLFVSPKLGPRFYYGSGCLLLAGWIALAGVVLSSRQLIPFVVLAISSSLYAAGHTLPLYDRLARASDRRMAELAAAPPGSVYVATAFEQVEETWWFYGDDFRDAKKRNLVAEYFGLLGVKFDAFDPFAPLGMTQARFVPIYKMDRPGCAPPEAGLVLGKVAGFDMAGLHHEIRAAIELLRARLRPAGFEQLDVSVIVDDPQVVLPRRRVLVSKWRPGHYESYVGQINRKRGAMTRILELPKQLVHTDYDVLIYRVGGEAKRLGGATGEPLQYVPWKPGVYWALACHSEECFVFAATRHGG